MKQPNDKYVFDPEDFMARQRAIFEKHGLLELWEPGSSVVTKPVPTAQEKAQEAFKPTLERVLKAEKQTCEQALKAKEEALKEAQVRRERDEYAQHVARINNSAIELAWAARQAEALAARRYDPTGIWGSPNYRKPGEEW
jgi:ABC-type ATPase with predicted acetyltransferase domain